MVAGAHGLGKTTFLNSLVRKKVFKDSLYLEKDEENQKKLSFLENGRESEGKSYEIKEDCILHNHNEKWSKSWFEEYQMTFEKTEVEVAEQGIHVDLTVIEIDNIG